MRSALPILARLILPSGSLLLASPAPPGIDQDAWSAAFRGEPVALRKSWRVHSEEFSRPQSLDGPRLWAAGHSDFGEVRFDPPGGKAYVHIGGRLKIRTHLAADGLRGGLVQSISASEAYEGQPENGKPGFTCAGCYWEARIRFSKAQGMWGAFWLLSPDDPLDRGHLEVDVIEYYGLGDPRGHHHSVHRWGPSEPNGHSSKGDYTGLHAISDHDWHIYGVDLRGLETIDGQKAVIFTMDGKELVRTAADDDYFEKPFYYVLSLSAHKNQQYANQMKAMSIDYVRAYQNVGNK